MTEIASPEIELSSEKQILYQHLGIGGRGNPHGDGYCGLQIENCHEGYQLIANGEIVWRSWETVKRRRRKACAAH